MPIHENEPGSLLDRVNKEPCLVNFLETPITYQCQDLDLVIDYYSVTDLPSHLHEWTFNLVQSNLLDMYKNSQGGWNEQEKRAEMLAPQARYLIARSATDPTDLKGFLLFQMIQEETMDDDIMANCAYCYEVQLMETARNKGLGEFLMGLLYQIGKHWKLDKVMLTVFKGKVFELDEISPGACLPHYKARLFDYELLSKPCK
ncbi:hypothetical protein HPULCUR_008508 [Helicostylum pulchrum]|uniref:N-alpha-acetyltransferase 40 n=1 Tax=Helicostylum pulchrum TaxID=562976 RepID=A0ABP9Y8W3_9FUNG